VVPETNKRIAPLSFFRGCRKGLIALIPEIDCDPTAMGLPPVTSALSNFGKTWVSQRNILEASVTPSGMKHEWYICMYN
jgi:hypothetical protein